MSNVIKQNWLISRRHVLRGIGSYNLADAVGHYNLCHKPVEPKARLTNLLLTMIQKMDVNAEQFVDSLGPVSEVMV